VPTVAVLAELLITGTQAMVWLYLFVCLLVGWDWLSFESAGAGANVQTLLVVALAYSLGVIVDRLADSALTTIDRRLGVRVVTPVPPEEMRVRVLIKGGEAANYLGYMRSRMRIARATVFNLGAIALFLALLAVALPNGGPSRELLVTATVATIASLVVSFWVARRIGKTYDERLAQTYRQLGSA
jgi:FtsH-binding integral membrane protein